MSRRARELDFPPLQSYQRLLVHKVAEYYNLGHRTPEVGVTDKRPVQMTKPEAIKKCAAKHTAATLHSVSLALLTPPFAPRPPATLRSLAPAAESAGPPKEFKIMRGPKKGNGATLPESARPGLLSVEQAKDRMPHAAPCPAAP